MTHPRRPRTTPRPGRAALALAALAGMAAGPDPRDVEFFESKVRPVLVARCVGCHGPQKQKGGLRLDARAAALAGGESGPAVVPGDPAKSLLVDAVRYGDAFQMPPQGKLPAAEVAALEAWVARGAVWPGGDKPADKVEARPADATGFWASRPPADPPVPAVRDAGWCRTPADRFVLAKLEAAGLRPAPEADRRTLIRRVTFDLTGLPPTYEDVTAFEGDPSPDAYERLVERLLASPHYGEKWARHWLDVARYADSVGGSVNHAFGNAWKYRDYVIRSFDRDKPYDAFVREQVAGDLLPPARDPEADRDRLIATGFLALGAKVLDELDPAKMEMDVVDEQIDTLGRAFLGLTLGCARCHDHKFDPVPTKDYYALAGVFKSTKTLEWFGRKDDKVPQWVEVPTAPAAELARHRDRLSAIDARRKELRAAEKNAAPKEQVQRLKRELKSLEDAVREPASVMAVREGRGEDVRVHVRGNHLTLGPAAPRGFPTALGGGPLPESARGGSGRRELAEWLARADHPLTARVMANRVWGWHFGRGLVATPDNFGRLGEPPTHPELLDWLARRFAAGGWSVKSLHRDILLSSAYRLSAAGGDRLVAADPDNKLFGRAHRRRLGAEEVRDAMLAAAGSLDRTRGGSLLRTANRQYVTGQAARTPERYDSPRRSLYLPVVRNGLYDFFRVFDFPEPSVPSGKRASTTVATQALFLMNSDWVGDRAGEFAARVGRAGGADADRVRAAFAAAYGRPPTAAEAGRALDYLSAYARAGGPPADAWRGLGRALLTSNEFLYVD